jgi:putative CRISPR-associated protein (TIGR02619 family)
MSDMPEMLYVGPVLVKFFEMRGYEVHSTVVEGLKYDEAHGQLVGLRRLATTLVDLIESCRRDGHHVALNPAGGFKAEIAHATVAAQLRQVEAYFVHEDHSEVIPLPCLPLDLDPGYWMHYREYFDEYADGVDAETHQRYQGFLPLGFSHMVEPRGARHCLSPAGQAFYLSLVYSDRAEGDHTRCKPITTKVPGK